MSLVHAYASEIEKIQDEKIRSFVVDALDSVPNHYKEYESYQEITNLVDETRKAIRLSETFLDVLDSADYISDIVTSAILLQDITRYEDRTDGQGEFWLEEDYAHPLTVRLKLSQFISGLGIDKFDDIMRTIESSHGFNSPIPQVMPTMEDSVYIWILPFVNKLAKNYMA